jgi:hypothetical protein
MEKVAREVAELFNRTTQICIVLEEDEKVQEWDQQEEKINISIQDLKKGQKKMSIMESLKGTREMKTRWKDLKTVQTNKKERKTQLESL